MLPELYYFTSLDLHTLLQVPSLRFTWLYSSFGMSEHTSDVKMSSLAEPLF